MEVTQSVNPISATLNLAGNDSATQHDGLHAETSYVKAEDCLPSDRMCTSLCNEGTLERPHSNPGSSSRGGVLIARDKKRTSSRPPWWHQPV